jgi:hypothetical protein
MQCSPQFGSYFYEFPLKNIWMPYCSYQMSPIATNCYIKLVLLFENFGPFITKIV